MKDITFIIKTFERFRCVKRLVKSIYDKYPDANVLIADDSEKSCKEYFMNTYTDKNIRVYEIEKDSGLSIGRNYLLDRVRTRYFVLLDDDFVFDNKTDIVKGLTILKENDLDILGGYFRNYSSVNGWFGALKVLIQEVIRFELPNNYIGNLNYDETSGTLFADYRIYDFPEYVRTDITHNFFIAKTEVIREKNRWDDELKLQEHTAFFLKAKLNGIKVGFSNLISVKHKPERLKKYNSYRNRNFVQLFMKKYNIKKIVATYDGNEQVVTYYNENK